MSLLMDALRKAEEAKKKAELESKSKPVVARPAAGDVDKSADIEIEFDLPAAEEPLLEDLAANTASSDAETVDTARRGKSFSGEDGEERAETNADERIAAAADARQTDSDAEIEQEDPTSLAAEPDAEAEETDDYVSPPPASRIPDYTRPATPVARGASDSRRAASKKPDSKPKVPGAAAASKPVVRDTYYIDFDSSPTVAAEPEPVIRAMPREAVTQRIRSQRQPEAEAETLDKSLEEQDRKSARSVFAVKRHASPLKKNMQLAAISVAAVLLVAIGIYFYISLRTGSGISYPTAGLANQQPPRQFTDAELEMADNELGFGTVGSPITPDAPALVTEPEIPPGQQSALAGTPANTPVSTPASPALNAQVNSPAVSAATDTANQPPVPGDNSSGAAVAVNAVANAPAVRPGAVQAPAAPAAVATAPALPEITAGAAATRAADNATVNTSSSASFNNNNAASLQPQRIEPEALVSFTRRTAAPADNPLIDNAYTAYQNGNLEQAERLYREILVTAPLHRNALLGLAAIAANRNDTVAALELYSRLLARDPNDPVAKAGILEIMPSGNLQQQETELRRLRDQHPDIAPLAYAFGNFLASQQRWSEAQQAYFSALQLAKNDAQGNPVNPDYAFNLAVSLEHLGQTRAAGNYYREALTFAELHPAGFSLDLARARLDSTGSVSNE